MKTELVLNATDVTADQLALVKKTIASGATDQELKLFLYDCERQGVHPLDKLIHFTKRGGKYVPITSIDLFRQRASSTGEYLGCSKPVWTGEAGKKGSKVEMCAKRAVGVHVAEHWAEAHWDEYCPPPGQDHMWRKMPFVMLSKVCEALALRKGFPKELAGMYEASEMDQGKEQTFGEAMTQDFPPGTWLDGMISKVLPTAGAMPSQLFIQTPDGLAQLSTFLPTAETEAVIGSQIQYQWGKQGKLRVVTEIRPKEPVSLTPVIPPEDVENMGQIVSGDDLSIDPGYPDDDEAVKLPQLIDDGDGEPDLEAFFAPDEDCRAVLSEYREDTTRNGKYVCRLVFECASGAIDVTSWDKPLKWSVTWEELLGKNVWFKASEGREYNGKKQYNLRDVALYN